MTETQGEWAFAVTAGGPWHCEASGGEPRPLVYGVGEERP